MNVVENIRLNVQYLRRRAGLTQEEMAYDLNMSEAYLRRIEKGRANPSIRKLEEIANLFMVNVPALLTTPRMDYPVRYVLRKQVRSFPGMGYYPTYGIYVILMSGTEAEEIVDFIDDVAVEKAVAQRIVRVCNEGQVAACQIREVIEDLLAQENFQNDGCGEPLPLEPDCYGLEEWDFPGE